MTSNKLPSPQLFKGIALFTPGGDLIYTLDPTKQGRWHLHLCSTLQEILDLPEPPHFLVPCYTATIDHWLDPHSKKIRTFAEAYPVVMRHQAVLNAIFGTGELVWQQAPWQEGLCDRMVLATYYSSFPQLWEDHDLVVRLDVSEPAQLYYQPVAVAQQVQSKTQGYVLRLFVAGHGPSTERILQNLHELLEQHLGQPYTLKVIDVLTHPEQAEANQVSATPTIVRVWPQPIRRIIGDLDNVEKILQMLGVPENGWGNAG
ncbi:circadian clock KaiB family protein [Aetokthonos hydrillicola Thurmond2011]|uniref:Circadian clock KaiB family protein n=2 Tax=Aetokthonos TaxID=1550243 RepID=A0AAP5I2G8_9CYAN|nr:circadian clock KaiB family protein [Aetokthonos hydrillicola]MBO3463608.1 circadian clock protein KaiB [Aetokthonos hydrillicola CCALA 1050]MBW4586579.1 circadian clock KaiB family protein [Aetokthonos hydrillicola CCALA 1050]MDR9893476.1 circadian clock KaiB family protein [Aetokthonos hydrillicola Thurmond2011]